MFKDIVLWTWTICRHETNIKDYRFVWVFNTDGLLGRTWVRRGIENPSVWDCSIYMSGRSPETLTMLGTWIRLPTENPFNSPTFSEWKSKCWKTNEWCGVRSTDHNHSRGGWDGGGVSEDFSASESQETTVHWQLKYTVKPTWCCGSINQFVITPTKILSQKPTVYFSHLKFIRLMGGITPSRSRLVLFTDWRVSVLP